VKGKRSQEKKGAVLYIGQGAIAKDPVENDSFMSCTGHCEHEKQFFNII
jgi:hypothetical protein